MGSFRAHGRFGYQPQTWRPIIRVIWKFFVPLVLVGVLVLSACTPRQAAQYLNATPHGHNHPALTADSAEAKKKAPQFRKFWRKVARAQAAQAAQSSLVKRWSGVANCESGGNWSISTGNGFYGGLQFLLSTWRGVGGKGYPHQNSREEQAYRAEILKGQVGLGAWPHCGSFYR